jgi:hypothetical protein
MPFAFLLFSPFVKCLYKSMENGNSFVMFEFNEWHKSSTMSSFRQHYCSNIPSARYNFGITVYRCLLCPFFRGWNFFNTSGLFAQLNTNKQSGRKTRIYSALLRASVCIQPILHPFKIFTAYHMLYTATCTSTGTNLLRKTLYQLNCYMTYSSFTLICIHSPSWIYRELSAGFLRSAAGGEAWRKEVASRGEQDLLFCGSSSSTVL